MTKKIKKAPPEPVEDLDDFFGDDAAEYTVKEKLFVLSYMTDAKMVGAQAARLAGYDAGSDNAFRVIACNLLKKPRILNKINELMQALTMPKFEILYRLTKEATASVLDVMNDQGQLDLDLARERGTDGLISEITIEERILETKVENVETPADLNLSRNERSKGTIETSLIGRKTKFKMYNAQNAKMLLGKFHSLFSDKLELSGKGGADLGGQVFLFLPDNGRQDASLPAPPVVKKRAAKPKGRSTTFGRKKRA